MTKAIKVLAIEVCTLLNSNSEKLFFFCLGNFLLQLRLAGTFKRFDIVMCKRALRKVNLRTGREQQGVNYGNTPGTADPTGSEMSY